MATIIPYLPHLPQQQQLNGEHLRQLEGEQQLLGDPGQQLRAASSLSESSTNSDSVSSVQDALNKLTLMGYDEVGYKHIRKIRGILILYLLNICTGTHCKLFRTFSCIVHIL